MKINAYKNQEEVLQIAKDLGDRIRTARIRRKISQQGLASRTGLSRSSIQSVERGDPTVSFGIILNVLWNLGLAREVALIADPGLDQGGLQLSLADGKRRVVAKRKIENDF